MELMWNVLCVFNFKVYNEFCIFYWIQTRSVMNMKPYVIVSLMLNQDRNEPLLLHANRARAPKMAVRNVSLSSVSISLVARGFSFRSDYSRLGVKQNYKQYTCGLGTQLMICTQLMYPSEKQQELSSLLEKAPPPIRRHPRISAAPE